MIFNAEPTLISSIALLVAALLGMVGLATRAGAAFWPRHQRTLGPIAFAAGLGGSAVLLGGIVLELSFRISGALPLPSPVTFDLLGGSVLLLALVFVFAFENAFYFVKSLGTRPAAY